MSRIYFHSEHGQAEVHGSERFHMGSICQDVFIKSLGSLHEHRDEPHWLRRVIKKGSYVLSPHYAGPKFADTVRTALNSVVSTNLVIDGVDRDLFSISLNSMLALGGDVGKLLARLHGQCEIHCYVEGANRDWLAGIIAAGRRDSVLRSDMGWETVIELLRSRSDGPVVCSYSVCDSFPNRHVADWSDDHDGDDWDELPDTEQWRLALLGIRKSPTLEMKPDNWGALRFGDGLSGFSLEAKARS